MRGFLSRGFSASHLQPAPSELGGDDGGAPGMLSQFLGASAGSDTQPLPPLPGKTHSPKASVGVLWI